MQTRLRLGAEAWPISREAPSRFPILEKIVIQSMHPEGPGTVHLSPDQALYVHSRLSLVATAFLHGHNDSVHHLDLPSLPVNHRQEMSRCGAKVWPIGSEREGETPVLEQVVIESQHPDGDGVIHLTPEQARYIHGRLTHITLAFLHENVWGGEDARDQ
ncbi:MAG TPA: hypothetical protein VFL82_01850 [Thermomicrobiales bacterium]|nr:hypothetical protein [Thermomicrobiales bacterium]